MLRPSATVPLVALIVLALSLSLGLLASQEVLAQSRHPAQARQMKDDVEQLAVDLHAGIDRSTLTPEQRTQLRDDLRDLREARQRHERFAEFRAARRIREILNSGAFKPEDEQRIKQDFQAIRELHADPPDSGM